MRSLYKSFIAAAFSVAVFTQASAQNSGKIIEQKTVTSKILNKDVKYTIYLPADYNISERTYPVVYLLHGYTDDNTGWLQFGEINRYKTGLKKAGKIPLARYMGAV